MGALAVVDDRAESRETVRLAIKAIAGSRFSVLGVEPLADKDDYPSWVIEEDVDALVLDERLGERAAPGRRHANYEGHQVVDSVRHSHPYLPIFVLTAWPNEPGLKERLGKVEEVIDRRRFNAAPAPYVQRIVRSASRYATERTKALAELGSLARDIAAGTASAAKKKRALALQTQLDTFLPIEQLATRAEWLDKAEDKLRAIGQARAKLEKRLKRAKK